MTRDEFEKLLDKLYIRSLRVGRCKPQSDAQYSWFKKTRILKESLLAEFDRLTAELAEAHENVQAFAHIIIAEVVEKRE